MKLTLKPIALGMFAAGMSSLAVTNVAHADDAFFEALTGGKVSFSARARYETVEQDGKLDADAYTLRTTLGYKTGDIKGFSGFIEFEDVTDLGDDDEYNSTKNGNTAYATVADPEDTSVSQAYLQYNGFDTEVKLGRQEITYRGAPFHRFVGNVLWRQNHQVFDALSISNTSLKDTKLSYAYLDKREFINLAKQEMDAHLFNVQYSGLSLGTLEGYGYLVEFDNVAALSAKTFGLRLSGAQAVNEDTKVIYTAEYATQDDYGNSTITDSQDYMLGELGLKYKGWMAKLSYELQEGDGTNSFKTPLGTNHAFQGWADNFLTTPSQGLEDIYFTVAGNVLGAKVIAVYHDFETDQGSIDAGEELDLLVAKKFAKHYTIGVKYADYNAGDLAGKVDTEKFWLWGQVNF
jgi:predicted RNA-binding protein with EMAP domain